MSFCILKHSKIENSYFDIPMLPDVEKTFRKAIAEHQKVQEKIVWNEEYLESVTGGLWDDKNGNNEVGQSTGVAAFAGWSEIQQDLQGRTVGNDSVCSKAYVLFKLCHRLCLRRLCRLSWDTVASRLRLNVYTHLEFVDEGRVGEL